MTYFDQSMKQGNNVPSPGLKNLCRMSACGGQLLEASVINL